MKKSLRINYIYNLFYQLLVMFLPIIITPYLSRVLGSENIGIYGFTTSVLSYFILFGGLGIDTCGQREIAFCQNNIEERSKVFWELFILKSIMISISVIFFILICYNDVQYGLYYKILTIQLVSNILDITWFYQGLEDFKKITIRSTIIRLLSLIGTFLFVKTGEDLINYFLIYCLTNLLGFLILWMKLKKYVKFVKFKSLNIFSHLKTSFTLFIPQIAIQVYTVLDKTMLGLLLNDMSEVGYYEQSQKIVKMCLMLVTALGGVMIPRIANLYINGKHEEINQKIASAFNIVSLVAFPMCFGLIAISSNFVPWFFGTGFLPVIRLLGIFSFLLIAIGYNNITGVQYLIPTKKQNKFTVSVVIGAIINLVLNLILMPLFKSTGAAIATVVSEFSILIVQIIYLKNVINFKAIFKTNIKYLFASIIMCLIVYPMSKVMSPTLLSTFIQITIGGIIYFIFLFISKDQILTEAIMMVKNIVRRGTTIENYNKKNN